MPEHRAAPAPTGEQWSIAHGSQVAVVTEVGATLRSYTTGAGDVVDGFSETEWSHAGRGQVLAPWPNRLRDGRYEWQGVKAQAALDEPARRNAIHGLVRWLPWSLEAHAQNVVSLRCALHPQPGYPFSIELRLEYRLGRDGLSVAVGAQASGERPAPFGIGFHPYLCVGTEEIDTAQLRVPGREHLVLDERGLPTGEVRGVVGTELDFTSSRPIGAVKLDTAYTRVERGSDGRARATLRAPSGERGVELWMDEGFGYVMCFTGDTVADPARRRRSVAIEPMTCPPDALSSGKDLIELTPGEPWEARWGIRPL